MFGFGKNKLTVTKVNELSLRNIHCVYLDTSRIESLKAFDIQFEVMIQSHILIQHVQRKKSRITVEGIYKPLFWFIF